MADGLAFEKWPPVPSTACAEGCHHAATGRYRGGYDADAGYDANVLVEERSCGAWVVMVANINYKF